MSREGMELVTQHLVMAASLNAHGNLFGGIMLAWLDEAAAIFGMRKIGYTNIVTVNMDDVDFKTPGRNGDMIQIYACIEKQGRSSFTVRTTAMSLQRDTLEEREVISCRITFVCLNQEGKPFPFFEIRTV